LLFGIAAESAAVMSSHTELRRREDAERLHEQMKKMEQGFHGIKS